MPLGSVDFSSVKDLETPTSGSFEGQTNGWEEREDDDNGNPRFYLHFEYRDDEGNTRKHRQTYNCGPDSLWRVKRDFVKMGADPADFEGNNINLIDICNEMFASPGIPVKLTFTKQTRGEYAGRGQLGAVELLT